MQNYSGKQTLQNVKQAIATAPVLKYIDSKARTVLQCVKHGAWSCHTSRRTTGDIRQQSVNRHRTRICTNRKELLTIVYGMERFDQYTYGRDIEVQLDHKPLEMTRGKRLHAAPI